MRRLLFITTCLLIFGNTFSQIGRQKTTIYKGDIYFYGGIAISSENRNLSSINRYPESKIFGYNIATKLGYFIHDNLSTGIGMRITHNNSENFNGNNTTYSSEYNSESLFLFVKKLLTVNNRFLLSVQTELIDTNVSQKTKNNNEQQNNSNTSYIKSNIFEIGLRPGISLFISKNIAFEASFGFLSFYSVATVSSDLNKETLSSNINFNFNSENLIFGLAIFL